MSYYDELDARNDPGYGLKISIVTDIYHDEGRKRGTFTQILEDPGVDDLVSAVLQTVEATYEWGMSRLELIEKIKEVLDEIREEYKPYTLPDDFKDDEWKIELADD